MGCGQSMNSDQEKVGNREINSQIKREKAQLKKQVKLLLLGAGNSGKSTLLKQMKLIHEGGYSPEERQAFKEIVFANTVHSMKAILEAMQEMQIQLDTTMVMYRDLVYALPLQVDHITPEVAEAIQVLWKDPCVLQVYDRSQEYQLHDSAKYYFDAMDRIKNPDYSPTDQDILRTRVKTTGITETTFEVKTLCYRMFDVGGQRSERKKWIHCFEHVTAIIFLVALSEFDQVLIEDENMNSMLEAFILFDSICNSKWFKTTSMILFMNKTDLFKDKLEKGHLLSTTFPDYQGNNTFEETSQYLVRKFLNLNKSKETGKQVYTHFTCATDTEQMKFVMAAVNDIIIQNNLRDVGLL